MSAWQWTDGEQITGTDGVYEARIERFMSNPTTARAIVTLGGEAKAFAIRRGVDKAKQWVESGWMRECPGDRSKWCRGRSVCARLGAAAHVDDPDPPK